MVNLPPPKKTVYATYGNTPAVRDGTALSGYVKDELWDRAQMLAYGEACAKAEREACAKVCEAEADRWRGEQDISDFRLCAAAIRAR